jgi:hypothetical protein
VYVKEFFAKSVRMDERKCYLNLIAILEIPYLLDSKKSPKKPERKSK